MKKTLVLLLTLAISLAVFAGCGDPCANGHTEGEWIIDSESTCTVAGSKHQVCSVCGETIKTEAIPAEHKEVVTDKGTASFTEAGTTDKVYCKTCGEVIAEAQEVEAAMYKDERYNENQPLYVVKKVGSDFSWNDIDSANIDYESWRDRKGYNPEASFQVVHTDESIIVKFTVKNDYLVSKETETNAIVCGDACVEFFVSPSSDPEHYYNFEMNSLGTLHLGYGIDAQHGETAEVEGRHIIDPEIIHQYTTMKVIPASTEPVETADGPRGEWGLELTINKEIFKVISGKEFGDKLAKGGFYKCGDLPKKEKARGSAEGHLLSWNHIDTKSKTNQGYHTTVDFGNIAFED